MASLKAGPKIRTVLILAVATLGATMITGLLATTAQARNPIANGATTLKLNQGTAKLLTANGVGVAPVKPASARGGGIRFPVTRGNIDPQTAQGRINHSGGLRFTAGGTRLVVRNFIVRINKRPILNAQAGGDRLNLLRLNTNRAVVGRNGLGVTVRRVPVALTGAAAQALNATFGVHLFRNGMRIGNVRTVAQPSTVALSDRGNTRLTIDPAVVGALTSLGVTPGPVGPAIATPTGVFAFPITGGRVNTSTYAGRVNHSGGISLTAGDIRVELTDFRINIDAAPDLTARLGDQRVSILSLDLSELEPSVRGRRINLSGVGASLTAEAAAALNGAFGVSAFAEGLTLGTADVRAVAN